MGLGTVDSTFLVVKQSEREREREREIESKF